MLCITGHQDQLAPTSSLSDCILKMRCLPLVCLPPRLLGIKPDPAHEAPYYMEGGMSIRTAGNVSGRGFGHNWDKIKNTNYLFPIEIQSHTSLMFIFSTLSNTFSHLSSGFHDKLRRLQLIYLSLEQSSLEQSSLPIVFKSRTEVGVGIKMGEGDQRVQTSIYKINQSLGCSVQHGHYS